MEAKELKEKCEMLFDHFDTPDELIGDRASFEGLLEELFEEEWLRIEPLVEKADLWDEAVQFYSKRGKVAFALGYVIGRLLDPSDRKILDAEKEIEKVIKEKKILFYLPREKKAA